MTKAVIIRTSGTVEPLTLSDADSGYLEIRNAVGGYIDAVRDERLVGYVHDEGLLIGLAPNVVASMLFERPLVGDVVLVGCRNEAGEYDGENYDVPEQFLSDEFRYLAQVLAGDEGLIDSLTKTIEAMDFAPKFIALDDDQFDKWVETGEFPTNEG